MAVIWEYWISLSRKQVIPMSAPQNLDDIIAMLAEKVRESYSRGFRDGASATRDRILKAAADEVPSGAIDAGKPQDERLQDRPSGTITRVERGAVRIAVQQVMTNRPGLPISEVAKRVSSLDPRITSIASVTNELNRNEGKLYKKAEGLWYRASEKSEGPAGIAARPSITNGAAVEAA